MGSVCSSPSTDRHAARDQGQNEVQKGNGAGMRVTLHVPHWTGRMDDANHDKDNLVQSPVDASCETSDQSDLNRRLSSTRHQGSPESGSPTDDLKAFSEAREVQWSVNEVPDLEKDVNFAKANRRHIVGAGQSRTARNSVLDSKLDGSGFHAAYKVGRSLGKGAFSTVRVATSRADGTKYAVKIMRLGSQTDLTLENIRREVKMLRDARHPSIVQLVEYFEETQKVYIVMELLQGGELLSALADCGSYTEEDAQSCFIQLLQTLSYLHANGIIHRDLKLENLIMTKPGERVNFIKLIDFGMAKFVWEPETDKTVIGTPLYVSPEILSSASKQSEKVNPYTRANDMWSAGVILHILLVGFPPFYGENEPALFKNIQAANYTFDGPEWSMVSNEAKDLVAKLLVVDPKRRISAEEALLHPWCSSSPKSSLENVRLNVRNLLAQRLKSVARSIVERIHRKSNSSSVEGFPYASAASSRRTSDNAETTGISNMLNKCQSLTDSPDGRIPAFTKSPSASKKAHPWRTSLDFSQALRSASFGRRRFQVSCS